MMRNPDARTISQAAILSGLTSMKFFQVTIEMNIKPCAEYLLAPHRRKTSGVSFLFSAQDIIKVMNVSKLIKT